jgi:hypothetical protein
MAPSRCRIGRRRSSPTDESVPVGRLSGWSDLSRGDLRGDDGGVFAYPVQER